MRTFKVINVKNYDVEKY